MSKEEEEEEEEERGVGDQNLSYLWKKVKKRKKKK